MNAPAQSMAISSEWVKPRTKLDGLSLMDHLYNRLDGYYPNVWRANFKGENAYTNWTTAWSDAFDEDGITPEDVANGIRACRKLYDKPPSLPQFLKACRPDEGMSIEAQFHRAVSEMTKRRKHQPQAWPSPGLFWAAAHIGHDMLTMDYRSIAGRWTAALSEHGSRTDPIPDVEPSRAIAAPVLSREESAKRLASLTQERLAKGGKMSHRERELMIADEIGRGVYKGGLWFKRQTARYLKSIGELPEHMAQFLTADEKGAV